MKPNTLIWALVLIVAMTLLFIVGLTVTIEGDAQPVIIIIMGLMTPIVTNILNLIKSQKTLEVSESTDQKVDTLVSSGIQDRLAHIDEVLAYQKNTERRFLRLEAALEDILEKVSK